MVEAPRPVEVALPAGVVEALTVGPEDVLVIRVPSNVVGVMFEQVAAAIEAGPLKGRVLLVAAEVDADHGLGRALAAERRRGGVAVVDDAAAPGLQELAVAAALDDDGGHSSASAAVSSQSRSITTSSEMI